MDSIKIHSAGSSWKTPRRTERTTAAQSASIASTLNPPPIHGAAVPQLMDLPLLRGGDYKPLAPPAASASPWVGAVVMESAPGSDFALDTI